MIASRSGGAPGACACADGGAAAGGGLWNSVAASLPARQQEDVGDRVLWYPQPGGGQQRQRPDPVRRVHGELGRDPAAERPAHHVRPAEPERVEHVQVVVHEVVDRLGGREVVRFPEPGVIGGEHREPGLGEQLVERVPCSGTAGRVQEQHRFAGAAAQQVHPPPGKLNELLRRNHLCHRVASNQVAPPHG